MFAVYSFDSNPFEFGGLHGVHSTLPTLSLHCRVYKCYTDEAIAGNRIQSADNEEVT